MNGGDLLAIVLDGIIERSLSNARRSIGRNDLEALDDTGRDLNQRRTYEQW